MNAAMNAMNKLCGGFPVLLSGFVLALGLLQPGAPVLAGDEPRPPPEARTAGTLGPQVMRAISEIQEMMTPEDPEDPVDLAGAKEALDELRERRWERMNDFEKSTLLNFYINYYLAQEDFTGALRTFEEMLTIEDLRPDTRLRTHRSLGQLYMAEENWSASIENLEIWRELSPEEDEVVFRNLSYSHYQLEDMLPARDYWLDYMNLALVNGNELEREDYAYLNGVYFTLESFPEALELTKTMIMKFDDPTDWQNLSAIYASLDREDERVRSLNLTYLRGLLDDDTRFLNLGQSMAGMEIPLSGRKILDDGFAQGLIPDDLENNTTLAQMSMLGAEYEQALAPALRAAELDDTGNSHDTLGYLYYVLNRYEDAVEAFREALDRGGLNDRSDTLLFLARSLLELDEFQAALEATADAREAADDAQARTAADNYREFIQSTRERYNVIATRRNDAIDFYQSYPSLID